MKNEWQNRGHYYYEDSWVKLIVAFQSVPPRFWLSTSRTTRKFKKNFFRRKQVYYIHSKLCFLLLKNIVYYRPALAQFLMLNQQRYINYDLSKILTLLYNLGSILYPSDHYARTLHFSLSISDRPCPFAAQNI